MVEFDGSEAVIAVLTTALTWVLGRFIDFEKNKTLKALLPTISILVATLVTATWAFVQSADAFSFAVLIKGIGAGLLAVAGSKQFDDLIDAAGGEDEEVVEPVEPPSEG